MWINVDEQEYQALCHQPTKSKKLLAFKKKLCDEWKRLKSPHQATLTEVARAMYGIEDDDKEISIDSDAAVSVADTHIYVQAWVCVPHYRWDGRYDLLEKLCIDVDVLEPLVRTTADSDDMAEAVLNAKTEPAVMDFLFDNGVGEEAIKAFLTASGVKFKS